MGINNKGCEMNVKTRDVKRKFKNLAPTEAYTLLDKYRIVSPYKEIIIAICIERMDTFTAMYHIRDKYNINLSYWTFVGKVKEALEMLVKSEEAEKRAKAQK